MTALVEKHFGKLAPATAGEKQARIAWLNAALGREKPATRRTGKALFTKHCAACHQLHGEGGKVGPDLTTADRKNRGYLLAHIVDPSGYIRPEFVVHNVLTTDGRKLSGIVDRDAASRSRSSTSSNDQPVKTVVAKKDIDDMTPVGRVADAGEAARHADRAGDRGPVRVPGERCAEAPPASRRASRRGDPTSEEAEGALVSGSFEYKSDESLAAFQKHLEANYPVECVAGRSQDRQGQTSPGWSTWRRATWRSSSPAGCRSTASAGRGEEVRRVGQADRRHPHREPRVPELARDGQGSVRRRLQGPLRREAGRAT